MNELFGLNIQMTHLATLWFIIMISSVLLCFIVSELTGNYSQVDKLWSLLPIVYSLVTLISMPSSRLWIMSLLVIIWGFRLSYNFYRKGGYSRIPWEGEEDYRWKILRQHPLLRGRLRFGMFNLLFISFYQNLLILLFSSPLLIAAGYSGSRLTWTDLTAALLMLFFILMEATADNQQYRFHKLKLRGLQPDSPYRDSLQQGFLSDGLWQYSRHPNFASEQAIWICFYVFGAAASGKWINWTLAGPLLLVLLFRGSSEMTERISLSKYPGYIGYKSDVPRFIPWKIAKRVRRKR